VSWCDRSYILVPTKWEESRSGLSALKYFRESELKHGRIAMLAVLGWVAVDLGLRLPGSKYAGVSPVEAHDVFVKSGDMFVGLLLIGILEVRRGWVGAVRDQWRPTLTTRGAVCCGAGDHGRGDL
jgi:hypothetical protein